MHSTNTDTGACGIVQVLIDALNHHDVGELILNYASGFVGLDSGQAHPANGTKEMELLLADYLRAFPDLEVQQERAYCDDDTVVFFWTARGTQLGTIMHIPPSGRRVEVRGVTNLLLKDGKIVQSDTIWDVAGMLRGIGLLPTLH